MTMSTQQAVEFLIGHVKNAASTRLRGGDYNAGSDGWQVSTQRLDGRLTPYIILICDQPEVLRRFIERARDEGFRVTIAEEAANAVLVSV